MKKECSIVIDLLPLYIEELVSAETAQYVSEHLKECPECQAELESLKGGAELTVIEKDLTSDPDSTQPFKKIMKRMNRQFNTLSYSLIIFFVFLGFSWTAGENLMFNSLIMPIVGIFGYIVFGWKSVYKMPLMVLIIDMFICLFKLIEIDVYSAFMWTIIYSSFVLVGIAIAFLLHFALRKEKNK